MYIKKVKYKQTQHTLTHKVLLNNLAFTLVELNVTIIILAILATITFTLFQSYNMQVRDSIRLNDINSINKSFEYFALSNWKYPFPTSWVDILFSWATLWNEWTFGNDTLTNVTTINKVPLDPLTNNEYTYSVTKKRDEYQIGYAYEQKDFYTILNNKFLIDKTYAFTWKDSLKTYIKWNYNGKILITQTWGVDYILAVPSIITSDHSDNNFENILSNKKLAFNNYSNLPSSYNPKVSKSDIWNFNFSQVESIVFRWDLNDMYEQETRLEFYTKISDVYTLSELQWKEWYKKFSEAYSDRFNPTYDYLNISCLVTEELLKRDFSCLSNTDQTKEVLAGNVNTWSLLANWDTNYVWQWLFWDINSAIWQSVWNANNDRTSMWMKGWINRSVWIKWKLFTTPNTPSLYLWWYDINGDWKENLLYWYWWKLFLWDILSWSNIWQTKTLDIKAILWVEDILWDGTKSIIVALWWDRYIWVINWKTGKLDWLSNNVTWPVKYVKPDWPSLDYKIFDINWDGINEYHFKQWYTKYNSLKFFESSWKVVWETLWSSQWYWDYNEWSDGYQPSTWSMWTMSWKLVVWAKGSNTFSFYSNDVNSSLTWIDKFKMPGFWKLKVWWNTWNGRSSSLWYFYDINWDGNDEYISRIDEELNNNKLSRLFVSWLNSTWSVVQYMSLSNPLIVNGSWAIISYWNFSTPIPLKNSSNLEDSYILTKWRDPVDWVNKWMMLKYNWLSTDWYKKNSNENESFNNNISYNIFDNSFTVGWIYNNWSKDYIALLKSGKYYFYNFTWTWTFLNPSSLIVTWSFFGNTLFDNGYDINREKNKNAWVFMASYDTNWNWKKEFVVTDWWYFKFYEIDDNWVNLIKTLWKYNTIAWIIKWWLASNGQDVYGINYTTSSNIINYYATNLASWSNVFNKLTSDYFYSWWNVKDIEISKLGKWEDKYNKLLIKWVWMFDARGANPTTSPIKLSNDFFNSYDMDRDWENEVFIWAKAYTYNSPGNYTLKYNYTWWVWDINWDWVLDQSWSYCWSTPIYIQNLFFTIRSWVDWSQIVPDIDP